MIAALVPFCVEDMVDIEDTRAIIESQALPGLVQLLAHGYCAEVHVAAVHAMYTLWISVDSGDEMPKLLEAFEDHGAFPALVSLLRSKDEGVQRDAAVALGWLPNVVDGEMIKLGAIPPLVSLLRSANEDVQTAAAETLLVALNQQFTKNTRRAQYDGLEASAAELVGAGAIRALVSLLGAARVRLQRAAACILGRLAMVVCFDSTPTGFIEAGCIQPLVALLGAVDDAVQQAAAFAICACAHGADEATCRSLVSHGLCDHLVPLLLRVCDGSDHLRWATLHAVDALVDIIEQPGAHRADIARAPGLVSALQRALHSCDVLIADGVGGGNPLRPVARLQPSALRALKGLLRCDGSDDAVLHRACASAGEAHARLADSEAELRRSHARLCSLGDAVGEPTRQHDVVLRCADGTELGASRLLLAQHSQYYERQLGGGLAEGSQRELAADPDFSSAAHEALLRQLHSAGVAPLPDETSVLLELARLVCKLRPPPPQEGSEGSAAAAVADVLVDVARRCEDSLLAGLDVDNCLDLLRHAKAMGGCPRLTEAVRTLAREQIKALTKQERWAAFKREDPAEAVELMETLALDMDDPCRRPSRKRKR